MQSLHSAGEEAGRTQSALARKLGIDASTLSRALSRKAARLGFVSVAPEFLTTLVHHSGLPLEAWTNDSVASFQLRLSGPDHSARSSVWNSFLSEAKKGAQAPATLLFDTSAQRTRGLRLPAQAARLNSVTSRLRLGDKVALQVAYPRWLDQQGTPFHLVILESYNDQWVALHCARERTTFEPSHNFPASGWLTVEEPLGFHQMLVTMSPPAMPVAIQEEIGLSVTADTRPVVLSPSVLSRLAVWLRSQAPKLSFSVLEFIIQ